MWTIRPVFWICVCVHGDFHGNAFLPGRHLSDVHALWCIQFHQIQYSPGKQNRLQKICVGVFGILLRYLLVQHILVITFAVFMPAGMC